MSDFLRILVIVFLVLGNAIFVAAEYGLVTARRSRLEAMDSRRARVALRLLDNPVRFIGTVQVAITAFSIALGAVGQPLLEQFFEPWMAGWVAFAIAFFILNFLSLVIGELLPKAVALQKAEAIASLLAIPLDLMQRILRPAVWTLQVSANALAGLFGVKPAPAGIAIHTEEDIRNTIAEGGESGVIEEAEQEMLYKVFDFADKEAHDVMVPRPQVVALSVDLPTREALGAMIDSPYTRYPVYSGSLDDVRGILHVRELFKALYDRGIENVQIQDLIRPAYVVPETKDLGALLAEFRRTNQHLAIVVNEYGGMEGIVTLEDLLEEIVGEIEDEYDLPDESVQRLENGHVRVDGTFPIDDFNEQFQQDLPDEDFHTVAGFVFGQLGRGAQAGDEVLHDGLRFEVVEVDGPRIERLEIEFLRQEEPSETAAVPEP